MKFISAVILTSLLGYASGLYLPWWSFAFTSMVVAFAVHQKPLLAFASGFLAMFLAWGIQAIIIDTANEHILSQKVANIFPLGGSSMSLVWITALIGGSVSGFAALTGCFARSMARSY